MRRFLILAILCYSVCAFPQALTNVQATSSNWSLCFLPSCNPGGSGTPTSFTQTFGSTSVISISGPAFSNGLAVYKVTGASSANTFTSDFNTTVSTTNAQAYEFDIFKFISGTEYMFGSQCLIGGNWQVWNQNASTWNNTSLVCSLTASTAHHITWSVHVCGTSMCYDILTIDGVENQIFMSEPSGSTAFGDAIGVQFQVDENGTGTSLTESLQNVNFTASSPAWSGLLNNVDSNFPGVTPTASAYGIDWSSNGVGGIPARTTICSTISSTGSDQSASINSALSSCPSGEAVLLNAGTFQIASHLTVPSNVTLRGSGANQTILNCTGSGSGCAIGGGGSVSYTGPLNITAGATAGSTSLTLSATTGVAIGRYLVVSETNNATWVTNVGTEGTCTWCDGWSTNGQRARGEIHEVTNLVGSVATIFPPLTSAYTNSPTAVPFTASAKFVGIENIQFFMNNSGYTNNVYFAECAYCWVTGSEMNYSDGNPIEIDWGYRDEIDNNYVSNAFTHAPGSTDSDIFLVLKTSWALVQNNILERQHVGIILNWGACCNVISYNYSHGNFDNSSNPSNCAPGTGACALLSAFLHHGSHPQFNLWEGNVGEQLYLDSVWGSSSHDTSMRGWYVGTSRVCAPASFGSGGRATVTTPCNYAFQAVRAVQNSQLSHYDNYVGDVVGSTQTNGISSTRVTFLVSPTSRCYNGCVDGYTFGYGESADGSGICTSTSTCTPYTSALLHGIYSGYDGTTTWSGSLTHTLPASFYLSSKPSWWGNTVPYPATGPDVSGSTLAGNPGGHSYGNPAMNCYLSTMGGSDGGVGSPLTFNASTCYPGGAGPTPAPAQPSNFIIAAIR